MYKIDKIEKENKRMHIIGRIVSIIIYSILIPVVVINFILIVKSIQNPKETPDFLGYKSFVIVSGSMEPTIQKGDAIIVKEVPQEEIKEGDIISFWEENAIITHRVKKITQDQEIILYTTKGDNNNTEDKKKVTYQQIEGKYQFKLKHFGILTQMIKSKITLCFLIVLLILLYRYQEGA